MVDGIRFIGVSALMSSISYTSGATTTYFFPSAIYSPLILFKRGSTKLTRMVASKGAEKAPPFCTTISFLFFSDVLGFTSFRILSQFMLIFLFSWSLTIIFLSMILMTHSQIACIWLQMFQQFFFSVLWKNNVTVST